MSDIAKLAGVSIGTVSRALANNPLVNKETSQRIQRIANAQNYKVNKQAGNLRNQRVKEVSILIPSPDASILLQDPFFLELFGGIALEMNMTKHDINLSGYNPVDLLGVQKSVIANRTDGAIVIGQSDLHETFNDLSDEFSNFVVWGGKLKGQKYCSVGSDNIKGGQLAARHLIEQGCRKIAFLGVKGWSECQLRLDGFLAAHEELGVTPCAELILDKSPDAKMSGELAVKQLITSGHEFDGIFATSDMLAISAITGLAKHGIKVPQQVAVVGYDDINFAKQVWPSLTTIRQDTLAGGKTLVHHILAIIEGKKPDSTMLPTELIVRKSSCYRER